VALRGSHELSGPFILLSPPALLLAALALVPLVIIAGVVLALVQRIREIGKGEIDDAKNY